MRPVLAWMAVVVGLVALATGCSGSDGAAGEAGPPGAPCTVVDNGDGTTTVTCPGSAPVTIPAGHDGADGAPCSVVDNGDGTNSITCPGSEPVTIPAGRDGADGTSCSVVDNGDGTKAITCSDGSSVTLLDGLNCTVASNVDGSRTISCPDGTTATISNGASCTVADDGAGTKTITCSDGTSATVTDGAGCSVTDNGDGSKTITCADGTTVTVANGAPCAVVDNGDGSKTVTCPDGAPVTIADGQPGSSCTVVDNGDRTRTISCTDGTSSIVADGSSCMVVDNGNGTKTVSCTDGTSATVTDGTDGSSCTVVDNADGTRTLSCADGTFTILSTPIDTQLGLQEPLPGVVVTIVGVGGASGATFAPGDHLALTFTVKTAAGRRIPLSELDFAAIWVAGPTTNYQHILPAARDQVYLTDLQTRSVMNADGSYTYTFAAPIPATYGVPLFDTAKFTDGELTGALQNGTYTVAMALSKSYFVAGAPVWDAGDATWDFGLGTAALTRREVVTDGNCDRCHQTIEGHGGTYKGVALCATCHTAGAEDMGSVDFGDSTPVTIDFRVLIHKIHDGWHLPSVQGITTNAAGARVYGVGTPYVVGTTDFSGTLYPAFPNFNVQMPKDAGYSGLLAAEKTRDNNVRTGVTACADCHGDPDGAGALPAPTDGARAYAAPTPAACYACHDDLDPTLPYAANGQTMPANANEAFCSLCHPAAALQTAHLHPLLDPIVTPQASVEVTAVSGGTGPNGNFLAGDTASVTFSVHDASGADLPITWFDSFSVGLTGPTQARQVVMPGALTATPFDLTGRVASASTTNKGVMSKVVPTVSPVSETLLVDFTSSTSFTVTGSVSGVLGLGSLPAATSTNSSGSSIGNIVLSPGAVAQTITVAFTGPTTYTVTGSISGVMGSGTMPASISNTQRFTSVDGTVAFNLVLGTTPPAAGNSFYMSIFKGSAANPVLFAVVAGRTAFAATDRIYFDFVAPGASYTLKVPMDLQVEFLGDAVTGAAGESLTAANLPVWFGRQTLYERTATPGVIQWTTTASTALARYIFVGYLDAGLAANDYLVLGENTAQEEYVRVSAIDATLKRIQVASPMRYAHPVNTAAQEVTLTFRQEGAANYYTLDPATGQVTFTAAHTIGNAFVMTYRTDGRFGWKRAAGDTLQAWYYAPLAETPGLDESWGDWRGKPLVAGTYDVALWGYRSIEYTSNGEWQTYRDTTKPTPFSFLYGASATTIAPYDRISSAADCDVCHNDISFHGGGRRGADACNMCHATPGPNVHYRTLLHELHAVGFPVKPNGAAACSRCHGATAVEEPSSRAHPTAQGYGSRDYGRTCVACHTSAGAQAHVEVNTSSTGAEACSVCHGVGAERSVAEVHAAR